MESNYDLGAQFPAGMRVLAIDDDPVHLSILERNLQGCKYEVTTKIRATEALKLLRENTNYFDLVITNIHMPNMDGLQLLRIVSHEMGLPVIMLSVDNDVEKMKQCLLYGASLYLVKPATVEELKYIWQYVLKKRMSRMEEQFGRGQFRPETNDKLNRERKLQNTSLDTDSTIINSKKSRHRWSEELHERFMAAVNQIGVSKATPKKILEVMNVENLTRDQVSSHLQKIKSSFLKRNPCLVKNNLTVQNVDPCVVAQPTPFLHSNVVPLWQPTVLSHSVQPQ